MASPNVGSPTTSCQCSTRKLADQQRPTASTAVAEDFEEVEVTLA